MKRCNNMQALKGAEHPPVCERCGTADTCHYMGLAQAVAAVQAPRLVILESPYAGDIAANVEYARACVRDSLSRGEAPIASHLLYTQPGILRDEDPQERQWGIDAGLAWGRVVTATVVYTDMGTSRGMEYGIANAKRAGRPIEYRSLHKKVR